MKTSAHIAIHLLLWVFFLLGVLTVSFQFLESVPDAPFAGHLPWVVTLELIMGVIFFYTTFLALPWASGKGGRTVILALILALLLAIFAFPAMKIGVWQVMSSVVPHVFMIFLALIFRRIPVVNS